MGHIAEPRNIDFIIESPPLSDKEREEISEFIKKLKEKKQTNPSKTRKKKDRSRASNKG